MLRSAGLNVNVKARVRTSVKVSAVSMLVLEFTAQ